MIAARVSGEAKTAFPATAKIKSGEVNVVVVADTVIFDDRFWIRIQNVLGKKIGAPFADNGAFVLNAVENLMGSSDLIGFAHADRSTASLHSRARHSGQGAGPVPAGRTGAATAPDGYAAAPACA
ncbi:MAG: hypothetical protein WDM89_04600 [Rhizomicrobium sp.]